MYDSQPRSGAPCRSNYRAILRVARVTRSSADAENRLDAFSGQSRSTNIVPLYMLHIVSYCAIVTLSLRRAVFTIFSYTGGFLSGGNCPGGALYPFISMSPALSRLYSASCPQDAMCRRSFSPGVSLFVTHICQVIFLRDLCGSVEHTQKTKLPLEAFPV